MSRSGYSDDLDNWALIRWRGRVASSIRGKRGQAMLRDLLSALDAMPVKELIANNFQAEGEFCTLGVLGAQRGIDMSGFGDDEWTDETAVAEAFNVAEPLVKEIMFLNDEYISDWGWEYVEICGPMRPYESHRRSVRVEKDCAGKERWRQMRGWVASQLKEPE